VPPRSVSQRADRSQPGWRQRPCHVRGGIASSMPQRARLAMDTPSHGQRAATTALVCGVGGRGNSRSALAPGWITSPTSSSLESLHSFRTLEDCMRYHDDFLLRKVYAPAPRSVRHDGSTLSSSSSAIRRSGRARDKSQDHVCFAPKDSSPAGKRAASISVLCCQIQARLRTACCRGRGKASELQTCSSLEFAAICPRAAAVDAAS